MMLLRVFLYVLCLCVTEVRIRIKVSIVDGDDDDRIRPQLFYVQILNWAQKARANLCVYVCC